MFSSTIGSVASLSLLLTKTGSGQRAEVMLTIEEAEDIDKERGVFETGIRDTISGGETSEPIMEFWGEVTQSATRCDASSTSKESCASLASSTRSRSE